MPPVRALLLVYQNLKLFSEIMILERFAAEKTPRNRHQIVRASSNT
jgi:hypothetical protein